MDTSFSSPSPFNKIKTKNKIIKRVKDILNTLKSIVI